MLQFCKLGSLKPSPSLSELYLEYPISGKLDVVAMSEL